LTIAVPLAPAAAQSTRGPAPDAADALSGAPLAAETAVPLLVAALELAAGWAYACCARTDSPIPIPVASTADKIARVLVILFMRSIFRE
jgi:hypothetical protein